MKALIVAQQWFDGLLSFEEKPVICYSVALSEIELTLFHDTEDNDTHSRLHFTKKNSEQGLSLFVAAYKNEIARKEIEKL